MCVATNTMTQTMRHASGMSDDFCAKFLRKLLVSRDLLLQPVLLGMSVSCRRQCRLRLELAVTEISSVCARTRSVLAGNGALVGDAQVEGGGQ